MSQATAAGDDRLKAKAVWTYSDYRLMPDDGQRCEVIFALAAGGYQLHARCGPGSRVDSKGFDLDLALDRVFGS